MTYLRNLSEICFQNIQQIYLNVNFMVHANVSQGGMVCLKKIFATVAYKCICLYGCVFCVCIVHIHVRVTKYRDMTCACNCEECHSSLHMYTHTGNKIRFLACFILLLPFPRCFTSHISITPAPVSRSVVVDRDQRHGENK